MSKYTFSYKIRCDYLDGMTPHAYTATGLGFCRDWSEAADLLYQQYGEELTEILSLYLMEGSAIIALPAQVVEDYKNTEFPDVDYQEAIQL